MFCNLVVLPVFYVHVTCFIDDDVDDDFIINNNNTLIVCSLIK